MYVRHLLLIKISIMEKNRTIRFEMRLERDLMLQIDKWSKEEHMSRSEAVRTLISRGLGIGISKGEKLILASLNNIVGELNLKNSKTELDFVVKSMSRGHSWAIDWDHEWLNHEDTSYERVKETVDILSMWDYLAYVYKNLSKEDQGAVDKVNRFKWNKFPGFDGNNEEHYGIARFLIEEMQRFTNFDPKNINSHTPMVHRYLEMYSEFNKLRYKEHKEIGVKELTAITEKF